MHLKNYIEFGIEQRFAPGRVQLAVVFDPTFATVTVVAMEPLGLLPVKVQLEDLLLV